MASTLTYIEQLAEDTAKSLSDNPSTWMTFLRTAARIYPYPFQDQLLIYAQRPQASACASIEIWNKRMNCRIKRGSKGIALIDDRQGGRRRLRYVFDVADTYLLPQIGRSPELWQLPFERENEIANWLHNEFMLEEDSYSDGTLLGTIMEYALEQTENVVDDVLHDVRDCMLDSRISQKSEQEQREELLRIVAHSSIYLMMQRCGFTDDYSVNEFRLIEDFNSLPVLSVVGQAVQEISRPFLREIHRYLHKYPVIGPETVEKNEKEVYNNFNTLIRKSNDKEGDIHDGESEIRAGGRSDDSGTDTERRDGGHREVRIPAAEIPEREQGETLQLNAAVGNTLPPSDGSEPESSGESGAVDRESSVEGSRTRQSNRSDGMGETSQSVPDAGRGNRDERDDLQLTEQRGEPESYEQIRLPFVDEASFPNEKKQTDRIVHGLSHQQKENLLASMVPDVLRSGGGLKGTSLRITAALQEGITGKELKNILMTEYGYGGKGFVFGEYHISVWYDGNGMDLAIGDAARGVADAHLSWDELTELVEQMYQGGIYTTSFVAGEALANERKETASALYFLVRDGLGKLPDRWKKSYPEAVEDIAGVLEDRNKCENLYLAYSKVKEYAITNGSKGYYMAHCDPCLERLKRLSRPTRMVPQQFEGEIPTPAFITSDEIDVVLQRGSGFSEGKFRIYEYFSGDYDKKDAADFLKKEYGMGGSSSALPYAQSFEDHSSKGIEIIKGRLTDSDVKVSLRWPVVVDRMQRLIQDGRYLSANEQIAYQKWKDAKEREEEIEPVEALPESKTDDLPKNGAEDSDRDPSTYEDTERENEPISEENVDEVYQEEEVQEADAEEEEHLREAQAEEAAQLEEEQIQEEEQERIEAGNYRIHDDRLGFGGPKEKFLRNVAAIRLLKSLEKRGLRATVEEQEILAQYVGWGGLSDAFDPTKENWKNEYQELKELLTPQEYNSAKASVLNSHYTQPIIMRAMYQAISSMGFTRGNVLEPSAGIGNFFGMVPDEMGGAKLYGVELDDISGRIARLLYPEAQIRIEGYENSNYPNDFFDVAIGNVPFGEYKVNDKKYNDRGFMIHDYFLAKTIDQLRPGGVMAFITSKMTMDKENANVRRYLNERAELLGAIRLPNNAFLGNAGAKVTSDILFFQKRDSISMEDAPWLRLGELPGKPGEAPVQVNQYFVDHPEMILGDMAMVSGPYGMRSDCLPKPDSSLEELLANVIGNIKGEITLAVDPDDELAEVEEMIPADPDVRNFSYTVVDGQIYYRENSWMRQANITDNVAARIKGMIGIRDCTREVIALQMSDSGTDEEILEAQRKLNEQYDHFTEEFGLINSAKNKRAFIQDSSYCLLCSLEILDEDGKLERKADMFFKRTIKKPEPITNVETAQEAFIVSLNEHAKVDLPYMSQLCGKSEETIIHDLKGVIFQHPTTKEWQSADEYLSGNVRSKLSIAEQMAIRHPEYQVNVDYLKPVIPKDLDASEIEVRLGATWIEPSDYEDFMQELFHTPRYYVGRQIKIQYSAINGQWNITNKSLDSTRNMLVTATYGTQRINAYYILEQSLNLKNVQIYDYIEDVDGKEKRVLNKQETMLASQKQDAIKAAFQEWVFKDPGRRERLCRVYNDRFNSIRPREYDGSHMRFPGMNPELELRPHQKNAVAHQLYGGNTLLAHVVGAGKTYEMVAAAMEGKRLGLYQKSLFVVPNHLTEQWGAEFLQLYPGANILVATKKDFEPANRKKFCGRIALGNYDAVIIGHSQFEKIPLSKERQRQIIHDQVNEITDAIEQLKYDKDEKFTVKQMEQTRKALQAKLEKLSDIKQDNVVTFEELGVDHLFVDEAHYYKNCFIYTKMKNVAGISQAEAQKSSDMLNKCIYMDEISNQKGVTFATGTPVSNSMTELYVMQRYLQRGRLTSMGLENFDAWASTFGEVVTAVELAPEGTGYRTKSRFSKFYNIPELMNVFKEIADIKTSDQLKLPVPDVVYENIVLKPSDQQRDVVLSLADRAEKVRNGEVDASVDNMLKITNDGRKVALDQRLINPLLGDYPGSKVNACADKCYAIWNETKAERMAQLIFCDLSTPKADGEFNVYTDMKQKLIDRGIPEKEIAFIHEANTDTRKAELFAKVRKGNIRVLLGSTAKMGAGTNVQDRLIALHHLDIGWKPSDLEQREGRIIRQGNRNETVRIFRYVTENTFDSYMWQLVESKQKFISQIMTSKAPVRSCADVDETALSYAEVKALATGNPAIKEKMELDVDVAKLKLLRANFFSNRYRLEDEITKGYPSTIAKYEKIIQGYQGNIDLYTREKEAAGDNFSMIIKGVTYTEKKEAGSMLIDLCMQMSDNGIEQMDIGTYMGFSMLISHAPLSVNYVLSLKGESVVQIYLGTDAIGNITRINHLLESLPNLLEDVRTQLETTKEQLEAAKIEVAKDFPKEEEYQQKVERLAELNVLLSVDHKKSGNAEPVPTSQVAESRETYHAMKAKAI